MPLSDIVLTDEEEEYNFNTLNPFDVKEPSYESMVIDPSADVEVRLASFSFGTRVDIQTKIGAIVVIGDEALLEKYSIPIGSLISNQKVEGYMLTALCLPETFDNWGLPDKFFSDVMIKCKNDVDLSDVTNDFYKLVMECNNISYLSSYEIVDKMKKNEFNTIIISYLMIITLSFVGIINIAIRLYGEVKRKSKTVARLRALGMPLDSLIVMVLRQNVYCPIIGLIVSIILTLFCQYFFIYIRKMIDSGAWTGVSFDTVPWYHYIPYRYS